MYNDAYVDNNIKIFELIIVIQKLKRNNVIVNIKHFGKKKFPLHLYKYFNALT